MLNSSRLIVYMMWLFIFDDSCVVNGMMNSCGRLVYMIILLICIGV